MHGYGFGWLVDDADVVNSVCRSHVFDQYGLEGKGILSQSQVSSDGNGQRIADHHQPWNDASNTRKHQFDTEQEVDAAHALAACSIAHASTCFTMPHDLRPLHHAIEA